MTENTAKTETSETATEEETNTVQGIEEPTMLETEETVAEPNTVEEPEEKPNKANREAAKYRTQLREAEAERDKLTELVTSYRAQILDTALSQRIGIPNPNPSISHDKNVTLNHPEDLFALGSVSREDFFTSGGDLDQGKLREAVGQLYERRPDLFNGAQKQTFIIPDEGGMPNFKGLGHDFQSAFTPKS